METLHIIKMPCLFVCRWGEKGIGQITHKATALTVDIQIMKQNITTIKNSDGEKFYCYHYH